MLKRKGKHEGRPKQFILKGGKLIKNKGFKDRRNRSKERKEKHDLAETMGYPRSPEEQPVSHGEILGMYFQPAGPKPGYPFPTEKQQKTDEEKEEARLKARKERPAFLQRLAKRMTEELEEKDDG